MVANVRMTQVIRLTVGTDLFSFESDKAVICSSINHWNYLLPSGTSVCRVHFLPVVCH